MPEGPMYPSLNLYDDVALQFLDECGAKIGDTVTAHIEFKLVGISANESPERKGASVSLDAVSLNDCEVASEKKEHDHGNYDGLIGQLMASRGKG